MRPSRAFKRNESALDYHIDSQGGLGQFGSGNAEFDELMASILKSRPKEENFSAEYPAIEIKNDLADIRRIKESPSFIKERSRGSVLAEEVIIKGAKSRDFFGENSTGFLTSEYDDIKRGCDLVVAIPNISDDDPLENPIFFAVDITAANDSEIIKRKLRMSLARISYQKTSPGNPGGRLTKLKYIKAGGIDRNRLMNHFVVPIESHQAQEMALTIVNDPSAEKTETTIERDIKTQIMLAIIKQASTQIIATLKNYEAEILPQCEEFLQDKKASSDEIRVVAMVSDNMDELQALFEIKKAPEMFESIFQNMIIILHMNDQLKKLEKNKSEVESNPANDTIHFLTHFTPTSAERIMK